MILIVLALFAALLVALNCFYNLSGLFCYVVGVKNSDSRDAFVRRSEEMVCFDDSDFDVCN